MKSYILLVIIVLGSITSCTLKRGVNEGEWEAYIVDSRNLESKIPIDLTINESKVYWDVYYTEDETEYHYDVIQHKDSLFLSLPNRNEMIKLKIVSKNELKGVWTDGNMTWNFEATYIEEK